MNKSKGQKKIFSMTKKEVEKFMDDCVNFTETNHPIDGDKDFMDILLEGQEIYNNYMEQKN